MGHSEMLLAVAGLTDEEIENRTRNLSSGDWSAFPAAERLGFHFGEQMTARPWTVSYENVQALVGTFGPLRTADLIWYASWCNYMTRVADAFQLPLEEENVFQQEPEREDAAEEDNDDAPGAEADRK